MLKTIFGLGLLFVVALLVVESADAIEVNRLRAPETIVAATVDSVMYSSTDAVYLPSSIIAFTGTGEEFWVQFWGDWDESGDNVFEWSLAGFGVPGAMTLPKVSEAQNRAGTYYTGWKFYCAGDSITVIAGDK